MLTDFIPQHCVPPHLRYELQRCSKASGRQLEKLYSLRCFNVHGGREMVACENAAYEKFTQDCVRAYADGALIITTTTQKVTYE